MEWACQIDWQAVALFAQAGAVFGAAVIASLKFDDWRKQFSYQRKAECAENALHAFYEAEDALSRVRSPLASGHENEKAREALEIDNPTRRQIQAQLSWNRIVEEREKWDAVIAQLAPTRIRFGMQTEQYLRGFLAQLRAVQVGVQMYAETEDREFRQKIEREFWYINDLDDVSIGVARAREGLEESFKEFTA